MQRVQLKSKIHLAKVTDANLDYEGSITVPEDLMREVDLWPGEKVLVVSRDSGARLETYVQPGPAGGGAIIINGAAARLVQPNDRITIMAFGLAERPVEARKVLCNEKNQIVRRSRGVELIVTPEALPLL